MRRRQRRRQQRRRRQRRFVVWVNCGYGDCGCSAVAAAADCFYYCWQHIAAAVAVFFFYNFPFYLS